MRRFRDLIGIVVSGVVEVVADGRGQHDEQVHAVHLLPQVRQPDQTIHLRNGITRVKIYLPYVRSQGALTIHTANVSRCWYRPPRHSDFFFNPS